MHFLNIVILCSFNYIDTIVVGKWTTNLSKLSFFHFYNYISNLYTFCIQSKIFQIINITMSYNSVLMKHLHFRNYMIYTLQKTSRARELNSQFLFFFFRQTLSIDYRTLVLTYYYENIPTKKTKKIL